MRCEICGSKIPIGEKECPVCGAKIQVEHKHDAKKDTIQHSPKADASGHIVQSKVTRDGRVSSILDDSKNFFEDVAKANGFSFDSLKDFMEEQGLDLSDVIPIVIIVIAVIIFIL